VPSLKAPAASQPISGTPEPLPALPPDFIREMKFDRASAEIEARYKRCASHWQPHLERTRALILRAAHLPTRRRKAVLFGAGLLHDIPLAELAAGYERVLLVDAVHSRSCQLRAAIFPNVECVQTDVTGTASHLLLARTARIPLSRIQPELFQNDPEVDLTVSVNLLSQIGCAPGKLLRDNHSDEEIRAFQRHLIESHLAYLRLCPGHSALITDFAWSTRVARKPTTKVPRYWEVLNGVVLPKPAEIWDWHIAPAPERDPHLDFIAHVAAFPDWKAAHPIAMRV
jgi:hypothetical protein